MDPRFFLPCFHGPHALRLGHKRKEKTRFNMGSKQYGVDHLNMEINKFTVERKVYHRFNQSQFRISILVFFRVNFTGY